MGETIDNNEVIAAAKQLVASLTQPQLEAAYLFGSRARGDYLNTSDVDLLLVSKDFEGIKFYERGLSLYDQWTLPVPLQVLCYTPTEFFKKKAQIGTVQDAAQQGLSLLDDR